MEINKRYWQDRYLSHDIGWDIGKISTPLKEYFDQLQDKNLKILIPGCGNAHEAVYLFHNGFKNVFLLDIVKEPLDDFKKRNPDFPENQLINEDFFEHSGKYDIIVEQTFFCALDPGLRNEYAKKMYELLVVGGKLVGLLFNDELNKDRPPFGGTKKEYISYFDKLFQIKNFDICYNSIPPRAGRELFVQLKKE